MLLEIGVDLRRKGCDFLTVVEAQIIFLLADDDMFLVVGIQEQLYRVLVGVALSNRSQFISDNLF